MDFIEYTMHKNISFSFSMIRLGCFSLCFIYLSSPVIGQNFCDAPNPHFAKRDGMYKKHSPDLGLSYNTLEAFKPKNDKCKQQLLTFNEALRNSSLWAVQILDASAKISEDLNDSDFGHFDECIDTDLRRKKDNIYGKYCLIGIKSTGWGYEDVQVRTRVKKVGVCIPNECGVEDIEATFRNYHRGFMKVVTSHCVTKQYALSKPGSQIFKSSILGLFSLVGLITCLDMLSPEKGSNVFWSKTIQIFSGYRNILRLTETNNIDKSFGLHFLKVITTSFFIMGRRYQILTQVPLKNFGYFEYPVLAIGPVSDIMIFSSGFLTVEKFRDEKINTKRRCFLSFLRSWLRLMPLYAVSIGFYAFLLEGLGNGPLWVDKIGTEAERCREYWWANLSFINNYISSSGQCMAQSWYLTVTAHCFLVTLIFMHLKAKKSIVGLGSFALLFASTIILFIWNDFALVTEQADSDSELLNNFFIKTHSRATSYIVGVISAFVYSRLTTSQGGNTRIRIFFASFMFAVFCAVFFVSSTISRNLDIKSRLLHSYASSLLRSIVIACVFIPFSLYTFDTFKTNLIKNILVPLSRVSYPVILFHSVVQLYMTGIMRNPEYITLSRLVWTGLADVFASYSIGVFLHLAIQGPIISAVAVFFRKEVRNEASKNEKDTEME